MFGGWAYTCLLSLSKGTWDTCTHVLLLTIVHETRVIYGEVWYVCCDDATGPRAVTKEPRAQWRKIVWNEEGTLLAISDR